MKHIKVMLTMLALALVMSLTAGIHADAKSYKIKKVTVTKGKSKTVKTSKKIKKVTICSTNKNFTVKKTANKKFKISGTDVGKTQTVKVTYTNKNTQKFKITTKKSIPSYARKIVKELKPLLANPNKGLKTVLNDWQKRLKPIPINGWVYKFKLANFKYGLGASIKSLTVDEILKNYTTSQKKALILEVYLRQRMQYGLAGHKRTESYWYNRNKNSFFKLLYQGQFWGKCGEGATMAYDICQYLGIKAKYVQSDELNHGWACIWVTDKNGTSYWHGIYTTSYPYSMNKSVPNKILTEAQVKKYVRSPYAATYFHAVATQVKNKSERKPAAPTVKPTGTPVKIPTGTQGQRIVIPFAEHQYTCPGCSAPYKHKDSKNPYITNGIIEVGSYKVYKHSTPTGIRYFDATGNEYIDVNNNGVITDELATLAAQ